MRYFATLLFLACSGSSSAVLPSAPSASAEAEGCAAPSAAALFEATRITGEVRGEMLLHSAQLDGGGPQEAVLRARTAEREDPNNPGSPETLIDHLVAFECRGDTWNATADWTFDATPDNGTFECDTGIRQLEIRRVAEREMLVVSTHQCQGSADPRWDEERVVVLAYKNERFSEAFACAVSEDHASGPCRSGASITRSLNISLDATPTIRVQTQRTFNPGACDDEEPGDEETDLRQEATYTWNGSTYVSDGEDVCR